MLYGFVFASRCWKTVGPLRCLAAVIAEIGFDFLAGVAIASLLGMRVGRNDEGPRP
jgi:hypothetical protein